MRIARGRAPAPSEQRTETFTGGVWADPVLAAERIARRLDTEETASDATPALAAELASAVDHWPEATELDTTETPSLVAQVANAMVGTT